MEAFGTWISFPFLFNVIGNSKQMNNFMHLIGIIIIYKEMRKSSQMFLKLGTFPSLYGIYIPCILDSKILYLTHFPDFSLPK